MESERIVKVQAINFGKQWVQLTEEGEQGGAVVHRGQPFLALHEQLAEHPGTGPVLACQHVDAIRVGGSHLSGESALCNQSRTVDINHAHRCSLAQ